MAKQRRIVNILSWMPPFLCRRALAEPHVIFSTTALTSFFSWLTGLLALVWVRRVLPTAFIGLGDVTLVTGYPKGRSMVRQWQTIAAHSSSILGREKVSTFDIRWIVDVNNFSFVRFVTTFGFGRLKKKFFLKRRRFRCVVAEAQLPRQMNCKVQKLRVIWFKVGCRDYLPVSTFTDNLDFEIIDSTSSRDWVCCPHRRRVLVVFTVTCEDTEWMYMKHMWRSHGTQRTYGIQACFQ